MSGRSIHLSRIVPHPDNVRRELGDLSELTASVREQGILQPLVVQPRPDGKYILLAGHRRLAAAKRLRMETVPVVVRPESDRGKAIEVMLVENCQRTDLSAVEKAEAMDALRGLGYSAASIAKAIGLSQGTVSYYLSLLDLDEESLARVAAGTVKVGHAVKAVRQARKARRGGATGRRVQAEAAWFTRRHRLAKAAAALCGHRTRPLVGDVACGQCWEQAIRDDQDGRAEVPRDEPERLTARQERMQILAGLRMNDGPVAAPGQVTAREAAERIGVTTRTIERYKADLAKAGAA